MLRVYDTLLIGLRAFGNCRKLDHLPLGNWLIVLYWDLAQSYLVHMYCICWGWEDAGQSHNGMAYHDFVVNAQWGNNNGPEQDCGCMCWGGLVVD